MAPSLGTDFTLIAPPDAPLLDQASNGNTRRLFMAARNSEAALQAASQEVASWIDKPVIEKFTGALAYFKAKRLLNTLTGRHRQNVAAFNSLVEATRPCAAYQSLVKRTVVPSLVQPRPEVAPKTKINMVDSDLLVRAPDQRTGSLSAPRRTLMPPSSGRAPAAEGSASVQQVRAIAPPALSAPGFSITVTPAGSRIAHLFAPRGRGVIPVPPPDVRSSSKIYLPVSEADIGAVTALGATVGKKGGVSIPAGLDLGPFEKWLPFYAKAVIEPLNVDLIPKTNWGGSLANLLSPSSWQALRQPALKQTGDKCIICGFDNRGKAVECHEIWEYFRARGGDIGVQKLVGIIPVCPACHGLFHLGRANLAGRFDEALGRLAWANRWSQGEANTYYHYVEQKWEMRNQLDWMLDVSILGPATLTLKGGKNGVQIDEYGDLHFPSSLGGGLTRLVGVSFGHSREDPHRPQPPLDYSQFVKDV